MAEVILVNENDIAIGSAEKIEAHRLGLKHRAFSVFIFNSRGEMLLQQRALSKYHSAGLWSNACCGHPAPAEEIKAAARRRLHEELGFTTELRNLLHFSYKASFPNGLIENEFDHVFVGDHDGEVNANPEEVSNIQFVSLGEIQSDIERQPEKYTVWFKIVFPKIENWWKRTYGQL